MGTFRNRQLFESYDIFDVKIFASLNEERLQIVHAEMVINHAYLLLLWQHTWELWCLGSQL